MKMKKAFQRIFIIWAVLFSLAFLSCPNDQASNGGSTLNADLLVTSIVYTDPVLTTANWTLGSNIKNNGPGSSGANTVRYYLSSDNALDGGDPVIGDTTIPEIEAGNTIPDTYSASYNISTAGIYYIFVQADLGDVVSETDETNNTTSASITVDQAGAASDLEVTTITVPGTPQTTTDTWTLGARVSNIDATTGAGASTLKYYRSADAVLDIPGDTSIGSKVIGPIAASSFVDDVWSVSYSINQGGTWYIFAVADGDSEVAESDEGNNNLSASVDIIFDRIVIETFSPTGVGAYSTDTYLALFDSAGDPTPLTPYDDTGALAQDRLSNPNHNWYSYIDYTLGLAPGTYYIKVRGNASNKTGPYGIRILTDPAVAYSYFGATNPAGTPWNDSYEDDDPMTGQIPTSPLSIRVGVQEDWHNRALADSDIDWFELQLD